jgi:serine phosphatase RsbU (regulator of sigma subunit)
VSTAECIQKRHLTEYSIFESFHEILRSAEFGFDRLEQLLRDNAGQPLPQLWELIMGEVKRHGVQQDDQTLLLLRVLT